MNQLYLLCKPYLISYQDYIDRLDSIPSSSRDIQTLEEAQSYWQKNFGNKSYLASCQFLFLVLY